VSVVNDDCSANKLIIAVLNNPAAGNVVVLLVFTSVYALTLLSNVILVVCNANYCVAPLLAYKLNTG
jgi:hypothetical protein